MNVEISFRAMRKLPVEVDHLFYLLTEFNSKVMEPDVVAAIESKDRPTLHEVLDASMAVATVLDYISDHC